MVSDPSNQSRKRSIVAALLYIEGVVLIALALWLGALGITHENRELLPLLGVVLFALGGAAGLLLCARGFARKKSYARAPAVLANLIALGVAYYQVQGAFYIGAIPLLLLADAPNHRRFYRHRGCAKSIVDTNVDRLSTPTRTAWRYQKYTQVGRLVQQG